MKISISWQTLFGRCLYQADGLWIFQNLHYRWLTFGNKTIQSIIKRKTPESPVLKYIPALTLPFRLNPGRSCMLGLGGAAVLHALVPFRQEELIEVVEINPAIIMIANQYFGLADIQNISIHCMNANHYVINHNQVFQHILVDLYTKESIPAECTTPLFFQNCYDALCYNGILAINIANRRDYLPILNQIRTCFNTLPLSIPIQHTANCVILAIKSNQFNALITLLETNKTLSKLIWHPQWGGIAEISVQKEYINDGTSK